MGFENREMILAVFVVTWNLNKERSNYNSARDEFIKQLDHYESKKDNGLESVRFISTNSTPDQISAFLRQKMDQNDRLFVSKLNKGEHRGWLNKDVWEWIKARL